MKKQTAVVGHPIAHSLSPALHNAIYKIERIDAELRAYDETDIARFVTKIREMPIELSAVTLPHKQTIMPLLDEIDAAAKEIGAVNTVINRNGTLIGYNTDIVGIAAALNGVDLEDKKVLLLGAGGAAQPLAGHLKKKRALIFCYSRELAKTKTLCERFGGVALDAAPSGEDSYDVIINATPLGLHASDPLPVPVELFTPNTVVFDLIYTPTALQREATARKARVITGLPMFLAQGLEQERLWLGREIRDSGYTLLLQEALQKNI